jgi:hypothetical protein
MDSLRDAAIQHDYEREFFTGGLVGLHSQGFVYSQMMNGAEEAFVFASPLHRWYVHDDVMYSPTAAEDLNLGTMP